MYKVIMLKSIGIEVVCYCVVVKTVPKNIVLTENKIRFP